MNSCHFCNCDLSITLDSAFAQALNSNKSVIIKCKNCSSHLGQFGYCPTCNLFTTYISPSALGPDKAICSKCGQSTYNGLPIVMSI